MWTKSWQLWAYWNETSNAKFVDRLATPADICQVMANGRAAVLLEEAADVDHVLAILGILKEEQACLPIRFGFELQP